MIRRIIILPRAERDADSIYEWIRARSPQGARAWWSSFDQATRRLTEQVDIAGQAPENDLFLEHIQQKIFRTDRGRRLPPTPGACILNMRITFRRLL
jgi:plasmid stabilization system protein ParE